MSEEKLDETVVTEPRRGSRSLFAPLALIGLGVIFLLDNLNLVPALDWSAALRYWPLALIFLGLNILVTQVRRPLGTLLSLVVSLAALGVFAYLLFGRAL